MTREELHQTWWYRLMTIIFVIAIVSSNATLLVFGYAELSRPSFEIHCANGKVFDSIPSCIGGGYDCEFAQGAALLKCDPTLFQKTPSLSDSERQSLYASSYTRVETLSPKASIILFQLVAVNIAAFLVYRAFFFVVMKEPFMGRMFAPKEVPAATAIDGKLFLRKVWDGDFGLGRAFWVGFIIFGVVWFHLLRSTLTPLLGSAYPVLQLAVLIYTAVGSWKAATRYTGHVLFAWATKAFLLISFAAIVYAIYAGATGQGF